MIAERRNNMAGNMEQLNSRIAKSGIKKKYIAETLGLNPKTLRFKLIGKTQFLPTEIEKLAGLLGLTDKEVLHIFFPQL